MIKFNGIAYLDGYDQGKKQKMNARVSPKNSKHAAEPPWREYMQSILLLTYDIF